MRNSSPFVIAGRGQEVADPLRETCPIFRMHTRQPNVIRGRRVGRETVERAVLGPPFIESIVDDVPSPGRHLAGLQGQPHPLLALAQRAFRALPLGDVDGNATDKAVAVFVGDGELHHQPGAQVTLAVGDLFDGFQQLAGCQHRRVVVAQPLGNFGREQFEVASS